MRGKIYVKKKYLRLLMALFLSACCGVINVSSFASPIRVEAAADKPNIIYIFSDEQIYSGWNKQNSEVYTPNLNRLAAEGTYFTQCVSNCPICVPYRNILVNGRMVRDTSVLRNIVNADYTTQYEGYAKHLQNAGYYTGYVGKLHLTSGLATVEQRQIFGYDYWQQTLGEDCLDVAYYDFKSGTNKIYEGYAATGQMTDAIRFVKEHANDDQPFMLTLSMFPPHAVKRGESYVNADAPQKWVDYYADKEITFREGVSESMRTQEAIDSIKQYYAHCSAIDEEVGRMLDAVQEAGIKDNTIVVFTSDHGDFLWTHNRTAGKGMPYEEAIRVPFIVSWPGKIEKGAVSDALFSAVDIAPTMLGLAGLDKPVYMDGINFAPMLLGENMNLPQAVFLSADEGGGGVWRGVRTERYTYSIGKYNFLFDNQKDPGQLNNLFDNPEYASIQAQLDKQLYELETQYGLDPMAGKWLDAFNIMGNEGSFESGDLEGWQSCVGGPCNGSITEEEAYTGNYSMAMRGRTNSWDTLGYNVLPLIKELGTGEYKFCLNAKKMPDNTNKFPRLIFRHDGASPNIVNNMGNVAPAVAEASSDENGWCTYILTVNITQALYNEICQRGKIWLCFDSLAGDLYIDNFRIYKSGVKSDYFDDGLVNNGDFESFETGTVLPMNITTDEWNPNLSGVTIVSSPAKSGERAAFISNRQFNYNTVMNRSLKSVIEKNGTGRYIASAYIKVAQGEEPTSFRMSLRDFGTGGRQYDSAPVTIGPQDGWVKFSLEVNFESMPKGDVGCYFNTPSTTVPFSDFYMDMFSFKKVELLLDQSDVELSLGESKKLNAFFSSYRNGKAVTWTCDRPDIVKVENGRITGLSLGNAIVTAMAEGLCATCSVTVKCPHAHTTIFPEKPSTCTEQGNTAYTVCKDCGKIISGSNEKLPLENHNWENYRSDNADEQKHYRICSVCKEKDAGEIHQWSADTATEESDKYCVVCGYIAEKFHVHQAVLVKGQDATCTQSGIKDYYTCSCGKFFEDEHCSREITDIDTWKKIAPKGHTDENQDLVCDLCGTKLAGSDSVQTGDVGSRYAWIVLVSAAAGAVLTGYKQKSQNKI